MKALSIRQPWAELILRGEKTIELRTWATHHRGTIAIHASKKVERDICDLYGLDPATLTTGSLVGTVEITETVPLDEQRWETLREQHLKPGPFPGDLLGWTLGNPQRWARAIPLKGRLGLFAVADEIITGAKPETEAQRPDASSQLRPQPIRKATGGPSQPNRQKAGQIYYDPNRPFELRVTPDKRGSYGLSLAQWPVTGSGDLPNRPQKLVDLNGDPLRAVADHILAALRQNGYKPTDLSATRRKPFYLDEETGLRLALLFLAIKPLTRLDRIEAISGALRVMPSEEAYYWFSKCTAQTGAANARRALRILLTQD